MATVRSPSSVRSPKDANGNFAAVGSEQFWMAWSSSSSSENVLREILQLFHRAARSPLQFFDERKVIFIDYSERDWATSEQRV